MLLPSTIHTSASTNRRVLSSFSAVFRRSRFGLALLLTSVTLTSSALACVVGTGTNASCTEAALNACLPGGGSFNGTVTFSCGGSATITVTATKTISSNTSIDGGGLITISGGNSVRVFSVSSGKNFNVQNLSIINGHVTSGAGAGQQSRPAFLHPSWGRGHKLLDRRI